MYGLPGDFDCSFLVGRTVETVSFAANVIFVRFDRDVMISVESSYSVSSSPTVESAIRNVPEFEPDLLKLVEHRGVAGDGRRDGTLTLTFDNGLVLRCYDPTPLYEAYHIKNGDRIVIV